MCVCICLSRGLYDAWSASGQPITILFFTTMKFKVHPRSNGIPACNVAKGRVHPAEQVAIHYLFQYKYLNESSVEETSQIKYNYHHVCYDHIGSKASKYRTHVSTKLSEV